MVTSPHYIPSIVRFLCSPRQISSFHITFFFVSTHNKNIISLKQKCKILRKLFQRVTASQQKKLSLMFFFLSINRISCISSCISIFVYYPLTPHCIAQRHGCIFCGPSHPLFIWVRFPLPYPEAKQLQFSQALLVSIFFFPMQKTSVFRVGYNSTVRMICPN